MSRITCLVLFLAVAGTATISRAEDWQQFRGPLANGIVTDGPVPAEWSAERNVRWKIDVPGSGWSAPLIAHGKVIVTTAVPVAGSDAEAKEGEPAAGAEKSDADRGSDKSGQIQRFEVHCFDLASGKPLWQRVAVEGQPREPKHNDNTYASETPVTDGERIIAYFGMMGLFCYDFDGQLLWQKDLGAFPMMADWGTASSLALDRGLVFVQVDNEQDSFLVALDAASGQQKWHVARDEKSTWCSPIIWKNKARTELVTGGKTIRSYDPQTGELLWQLAVGERASSASPAGDAEMLIVGGRGLFAVLAGAQGDITPNTGETTSSGVLWSNEAGAPAMASPLVYKGFVYICDRRGGVVTCYDAANGKQAYKERLPGNREFWASPWAADGKVFCTDDTGVTHVLAAGPEFKLLGANSLDGKFWASSAIADGSLLLRSTDKLYCIGSAATPAGVQATRPQGALPVRR